jgi:hypothetical protein
MYKVPVLIAICMVVGLVLTVVSQDTELDPLMKQVPGLNTSLGQKIAANDAAGAAADAAKLEAIFKSTEDFFTSKNIAAGINWSKETKIAAGEVVKAAKANNMEAAKAAAANVGKNCKACHQAHRVQDPTTKAYSFKP